jgi:hypothetical protein
MDSSYTSYSPLLLCFGYIEINILNYLLQTPEVDQISLVHAIYELVGLSKLWCEAFGIE